MKSFKAALLTLLLLPVSNILANNITIASPDEKTVVILSDDEGLLTWSVNYNKQTAIERSPLGITTNEGFIGKDIYIKEESRNHISEDYQLNRCKTSNVHYEANQAIVAVSPLKSDKNLPKLSLEFQVSNNNIAFRYCIAPSSNDRRCVNVLSEQTSFDFPEGTISYLTPLSDPMTGWKRTKPSYEEEYTIGTSLGQKSKYGHGYTFPCLFNTASGIITARGSHQDMKMRIGESIWLLISETGVDSHYCGSHLSEVDAFGHCSIEYPLEGENNGFGSSGAQISLPGQTPWRTITIGNSLKPIAETTIPFDVVKPLYEPTTEYLYGRSTWSWMVWDDASINENDIRSYIDLAASLGWEYSLVDNYWDEKIGRDKMEELSRYAQSKGIHLFLWYNSAGSWNDTYQSPYDIMSNVISRRREMAWLQKIGVKGIKVDFWGGDKQETMRLYEEVLADANDYGLMVIFHGCTLPRGWERMYPNYVGSEAVLASENLKFNQHFDDMEATNACLHPFIRNSVGCMEFGGSALNHYYHQDNATGSRRVTGDAFELACAILFQNPIQNFAITPNNLTDAPADAITFMKNVPTTWDETIFLDGYPGKYVVMARRHGSTWFVAAINATSKDITYDLTPSTFGFKGNSIKIYADDKKLKFSVKDTKINKKGNITLTIPTNGGSIAIIP